MFDSSTQCHEPTARGRLNMHMVMVSWQKSHNACRLPRVTLPVGMHCRCFQEGPLQLHCYVFAPVCCCTNHMEADDEKWC